MNRALRVAATAVVAILVLAGGLLLAGIGDEGDASYSPQVGDYIEWNTEYNPNSTKPPLFNQTERYTVLEVTETNIIVEESVWYPERLTQEMIDLNQRPLPQVTNYSLPPAGFSWLNVNFKNSTWAGFDVHRLGNQLVSTEYGQLDCRYYRLTTENPSTPGQTIVVMEFWTYHALLIKMASSYYTNNFLLIDTNIGLIAG